MRLLSLCLLTTAISASAGIQTDGVSYDEITTDNAILKVENLWYYPNLVKMASSIPISIQYPGYSAYDCLNYTFVTNNSLFFTNTCDSKTRVPSLARLDLKTRECDTKLYECEYDEGLENETESYRWYSGNMDTAGNPFVTTKATVVNSVSQPLRISVLYPYESEKGNPIVRCFYNLSKNSNWNIYKVEVSGDLSSGNFIAWACAGVGNDAQDGLKNRTLAIRWKFEDGEQVSRDEYNQPYNCMSIREYENGNILVYDADDNAGFGYPTLCKIEDDKFVAVSEPIQADKFADTAGAAFATFSLNGEDYIVYQTASAKSNSQFAVSKLENFPNDLNVCQDLWTLPGDDKSLCNRDNVNDFEFKSSERATVRVVTDEDSNSATLYFMACRAGIAAYRITAEARNNINTGIESVTINNDTTVDIYSLAGVCVANSTTITAAKQSLAKGVYIAKSSNATPCKFIVK